VIQNRTLWAVMSIVMGGLQAWDSGVLAAGGSAQMLAGAGVLLPALALVASNRWDVWVVCLIVGAILLVWARWVSPVSLNTIHLGLFVPAIYVFFVCRMEKRWQPPEP
jgi:hypothetical protein